MKILTTVFDLNIKLLVFLLPLYFLPITGEFFSFNKLVLLTVLTLSGWVFWSLARLGGSFRFRVTPFDLPVLALALVFLLSAILVSPNKFDAFVFPGTASHIIVGSALYFLLVQYLSGKSEGSANLFNLTGLLFLGTAVSALITTLSGLGVLASLGELLKLPNWLSQKSFNTVGDLLTAISLYLVVAVLGLARAIETKRTTYSAVNVFLLVVVIAGLVAGVYQSLPGAQNAINLLPLSSGWAIALETLKNNLLLGVGPGNFVEAFNKFRPVEFNSSAVWNLRFISSTNWYLHVWTIGGLLGIVGFLWLVLKILKGLKSQVLNPIHWTMLAVLTVFLLAPVGIVMVAVFYILLAIIASGKGDDLSLQFAAHEPGGEGRRTNLLPSIFALISGALLVGLFYWGGKIYLAEVSFRNTLNAFSVNDGRAAYDSIAKTVRLNPQSVQYRITSSQINLAIANSIARQENLTDEQRNTVSQLIQQAIREAQAAVALNRSNAVPWENLGRLYQSLMSFAQDADDFAISSYQQAIALDPLNPSLRLSLGGVFYSLKQYDDAVRAFEIATASKPDLANAHYNLAVALREKGNFNRAYTEMQTTLSLIKTDSQDYTKAKAELDELQKKVAEIKETEKAQQGQTGGANQAPLQAPQPAGEPVLDPPINLPDSAAPPSTTSTEPVQLD